MSKHGLRRVSCVGTKVIERSHPAPVVPEPPAPEKDETTDPAEDAADEKEHE